ncbi:hypothetical protein HZB08_00220 [Candidatus Saganbacteria bacterium]|uniref:PorV/PorQ family protein n=1 Tax=Candidatus Saganbacteria bacterium TaxID=2575572 RepID=A0A9D6ULL8_UNCSA|nr:hypothetical protein [Candidatus Saganbacteria bacterium]
MGVPARAVGMGKALLTRQGDISGAFLNPAAFAGIDDWQMTTMTVKAAEGFNYYSLAGVLPSPAGNFGIGMVNMSVDGVPYASAYDVATGNPVLENTEENNLALVLTYARKIRNLSWGLSLKSFSTAYSALKEKGSGVDADLGITLNLSPVVVSRRVFSLVAYNFLPTRFSYSTGREEGMPFMLRGGFGMDVGEKIAIEAGGDYRQEHPIIFRGGLEYRANSILSLRAGVEQEAVPQGDGKVETVNDLCFGTSLSLRGISFDYGYRQFNRPAGGANHFFSISFK